MNNKSDQSLSLGILFVAMGFCGLLFSGCELNEDSTTSVTLSPASVYLNAGAVSIVEFTASGGDSNYTWSVSDISLGTIYEASTAIAFYQSTTNSGTNTLTVTDSSSNSARAKIIQR